MNLNVPAVILPKICPRGILGIFCIFENAFALFEKFFGVLCVYYFLGIMGEGRVDHICIIWGEILFF
jgi:hypothetical protein